MLKRFLLLILTAMFMATAVVAEAAPGNRLRLTYIKPGNPAFPNTQTVNFGVKTLVDLGGSPMQYKNPQLLGITRWLAITSQVDVSSNPVAIFQLDDRQMLVPKNGAGAYGTTWGAPANGPYTVGVAEYFDAAHTFPTGASTIITVPIIPAAAHIREMTSVRGGCVALPCEGDAANPDGGTTWASTGASFNSTANQLSKTLGENTTAIIQGDTIYGRDGYFNPTDLAYHVRPPLCASTRWTCPGGGRVTFISETVDNTLDTNGNPQLKNGFKFGAGIAIDTTLSGDVVIPLDFKSLWCYVEQVLGVYFPCVNFNSASAGTGLSLYNTRCEATAAAYQLNAGTPNCIKTRGPFVVDHNHSIRMGKVIIISDTGINTGQGTITNNVDELGQDDFINIEGCNNTVNDNFMFNPAGANGAHQDFAQGNGATTACNFGEEARNILVTNDFSLHQGSDPQFLFNANPTGHTSTLSNANIHNNIGNNTTLPGVSMSYWNAPNINNNTSLGLVSATTTATGTIVGSTLILTTAPNTLLYSGMPVTGAGVLANTTVTGTPTQWNPATMQASATVTPGGQTVSVGETLTLATIFNAGVNFQTGQLVCCDANVLNNVSNTYVNMAGQPGTVLTTNSLTIPIDNTKYVAAFPNYVQGNGPVGVTNRGAAITYFTPANRLTSASPPGVINADGTVSGALTPADSSGHACWADHTTVFDNTKTCAQMGLTQAS